MDYEVGGVKPRARPKENLERLWKKTVRLDN